MMNEDTMKFNLPRDSRSIIKVIGVGGGGGNAVNHMYNEGIRDVDFLICNTDAQALFESPIPNKVQLGVHLTEGLGAGSNPERGEASAIENMEEIKNLLDDGTKMVFITVGMGGGTGTGAAPVIAKIAKELDILTIAIASIPFKFEGKKRVLQAIEGIEKIKEHVDSLLVVNNEKLMSIHSDVTTDEAYGIADDILLTAAKGIAEIITVHGHINVDFADVKTVMSNSGVALMGTGVASGENRALAAAKTAVESPLLSNNNILGAKQILLNIISGKAHRSTMKEMNDISEYVQDLTGNNADVIMGEGASEDLDEEISVTIIATGFKESSIDGLVASNKTVEQSQPLPEINLDPEKSIEPKDSDEEKIKDVYGEGKAELVGINKGNTENKENESRQEEGMSEDELVEEYYRVPAYLRKKRKEKNESE